MCIRDRFPDLPALPLDRVCDDGNAASTFVGVAFGKLRHVPRPAETEEGDFQREATQGKALGDVQENGGRSWKVD